MSNEITGTNVESGQPTIAETVPSQQAPPPSPPNYHESAVSENEIQSGTEPPATEYNAVDPGEVSTERPPAPITQRKNRRRKKKPYAQEDDSIDEEFASRLDMSCNDEVNEPAPTLENSSISGYIRYDLFENYNLT